MSARAADAAIDERSSTLALVGAAAFGALGAFCPFGAPAAPTRASVLLRSSMAASEARALMLIACGSPLLVEQLLLCRSRCVL